MYAYDVTLVETNLYPPKFNRSVYYLNVTENNSPGMLLDMEATDEDFEGAIMYSLLDQTSSTFPFSIDSWFGNISATSAFDRETLDHYSVVVLAMDRGSPQLTGTAVVSVTILDVNDNPPLFGNIPKEIYIEESVPVGYVLCNISVTDADVGLNGEVDVSLRVGAHLFGLSNTMEALVTNASLIGRIGNHDISFLAQDRGTPALNTTFNLTVHVVRTNLHAPEFNQTEYEFTVNETAVTGNFVGEVLATDRDGGILHFSIVYASTLPFTIDPESGVPQKQAAPVFRPAEYLQLPSAGDR